MRHVYFSGEFLFWQTFKIITFIRKLLRHSPKLQKIKKAYQSSCHLTKFKMCSSPAVVQFGLQFSLIAVHFNSFCVKVNSIDEISFLEGLITLIPINISCGCKEKINNNFCPSLWWYLISVKAELPRSGDLKSSDFSFCASCHFCTCLTSPIP